MLFNFDPKDPPNIDTAEAEFEVILWTENK